MTRRLQLGLALACIAAAALALALALTGPPRSGGGAAEASSQGFDGALLPRGLPPRDFTLSDERGRRVSLHDYRGGVALVTFMHALCHASCPIVAQQIRGAFDDLGRSVPAFAVSVSPAEDTAAAARAFLARQHVAGRLRFLLGSPAQLAPVWRAFAIAPQRGSSDTHTVHVFLLDRRGVPRVGFPQQAITPETIAHDIRRLERER
ncbi:MAG: redoxin domain-containing protein [Actinobacteria bacterium]|nr:MAG: redoxin domain-containing protein [Actinomycetota bacterium]